MNELRLIRKNNNITQENAARMLNISRKTYQKYESLDDSNDYKLEFFIYKLKELTLIDEDHGILSIEKIKEVVNEVMKKYSINVCYLFGSYAKGYAREDSDIDLLIDSNVNGLDFYGLIEELREKLHKRIDLLTLNSLSNQSPIISEVLKDGIKIYG